MRQLQIKNGLASSEWNGGGGLPVPPDASWTFLDVTARPEAQVGMSYDIATDTFSAVPVVVKPKRLSRFEFMSHLSAAERIALRTRATTDTVMADALAMLELAGHVECEPLYPMVVQMLDYVQSVGMMTADRRAAFVAAIRAAAY